MSEPSVSVTRSEILDLINCAEDYGLDNPVLMETLAEWLGFLPDEEIVRYAATFLEQEQLDAGYSGLDAEEAAKRLRRFRERYVK